MEKFKIKDDHIELLQLIKFMGLSDTGGQAKQLVDDRLVKVNGVEETRYRAKLKPGDKVEIGDEIFIME